MYNAQHSEHCTNCETEEDVRAHIQKDYRDGRILNILDQLLKNFHDTVETSTGVWFNQNNLVMLLIAFMNSTFRESCDDELRFLNVINQTIKTANIKSQIQAKEINKELDIPALNFLLQAADVEYNDDYDEDDFLSKHNNSLNTYGTGVVKVMGKEGTPVNKSVPFPQIIWHPNDFENHPMGEVFDTSLTKLMDSNVFEEDKVNELVAKLTNSAGKSFDANRMKVKLYEVHGKLPKDIFEGGAKGIEQGMFIVAESEYQDRVVLYSGREEEHPYMVDRREVVHNRSMGRGIGEEMIHTQITTNELMNLILEQLRSSKIFYQTADTELDGQDLQEIDNMTLISHEDGSPITQVSAQPLAYGALSSFQEYVIDSGRRNASVQDFSLGIGPKSNTSFASIQAAAKEADSQYTYTKNQTFRFVKRLYKKKGGYIDRLVDYFDSEKDIESLLSPYQLRSMKRFIAKKKAEAIVAEQDGNLYVDDIDEVANFILEDVKGQTHKINIDEPIDRDYIRDKVRLTLGGENGIISKKIASLELKLRNVLSNPEAFPSSNPEQLQDQIIELQDLATAHSSGDGSSQIGITTTGPQVAAEAGLVNSPILG